MARTSIKASVYSQVLSEDRSKDPVTIYDRNNSELNNSDNDDSDFKFPDICTADRWANFIQRVTQRNERNKSFATFW